MTHVKVTDHQNAFNNCDRVESITLECLFNHYSPWWPSNPNFSDGSW